MARDPIRHASMLAAANLFSQVLALATAPLLARLYTPADFGVLGVFVAVSSVILAVSSLRYELAVPLPASSEDAVHVLTLSLLVNLVTTVVTGVAAVVLGGRLATSLGADALIPHLWLVPAVVLVTGTFQALSYWSIRQQQFRLLSQARLAQSSAQAAVSVAMGLLGLRPLGLLLGNALGRAAGVVSLMRKSAAEISELDHRTSAANVRRAAARYKRFPFIASWVGLLSEAGLNLPPIMLGWLYGATPAGWFVLTGRLIATPMGLLGKATSQVFMGEAARRAIRDPGGLVRLYRATVVRLTVLGGVAVGAIALLAPIVLPTLLGPDWAETGVYAQIIAPMFLAQFVASPVSQTLTVLEKQGSQLAFSFGKFVLGAAMFLVVERMGGSARATLLAYSAAMTLTYVFLVWFAHRAVKRHAERSSGSTMAPNQSAGGSAQSGNDSDDDGDPRPETTSR